MLRGHERTHECKVPSPAHSNEDDPGEGGLGICCRTTPCQFDCDLVVVRSVCSPVPSNLVEKGEKGQSRARRGEGTRVQDVAQCVVQR